MANVITLFRIFFAFAMLLTIPFSVAFWIFYFCGGFSDFLDGFVARKWNLESVFGAQLDSIADLIFAVSMGIVVITNIQLPTWIWICITLIIVLRLLGYGIGFYKYHTFTSLHTYMNKATGVFIFLSPILYILLGMTVTGTFICTMAFLSALEEIVITTKSKGLNRDCKSIFDY
ncbi:MAG: CDP-alcohol phosphatidyltransferase family protein [Anaerorhabdus sp.]|uniref:CDP-alcohol phosphatidyltransferase family protein n=1 Tax=Anaerorhabdus sp. TaxID=1872524 RepID=UPI002FCB4245